LIPNALHLESRACLASERTNIPAEARTVPVFSQHASTARKTRISTAINSRRKSKTSIVRAWRGQGYAYTELQQWDAAEKIYHQSLALDKSDHRSLQELEYIQKQRSAQGPSPAH
jgi:hypothetical protein